MDKSISDSAIKYLKVLCIEEANTIRESLGYSLKCLTQEVKSVTNGMESIEVFYSFRPDLIITGLKMSEVNGVEFIKKVREENSFIPIIVISEYPDKEDFLDLINLQVTSFLLKPVKNTELMEALIGSVELLIKQGKFNLKINNNITFDKNNFKLILPHKEVALNNKEAKLLNLLINNSNKISTYQEIESVVWNDGVMTNGALKTLVNSLTVKAKEKFITNLSQVGYKLV